MSRDLHPALAALPNAEHIACVLASLRADPGKWDAAWDALAALIAWDHAGEYLAWDYDKLHAHWLITEEPAALLLLPAVRVFSGDTKEVV